MERKASKSPQRKTLSMLLTGEYPDISSHIYPRLNLQELQALRLVSKVIKQHPELIKELQEIKKLAQQKKEVNYLISLLRYPDYISFDENLDDLTDMYLGGTESLKNYILMSMKRLHRSQTLPFKFIANVFARTDNYNQYLNEFLQSSVLDEDHLYEAFTEGFINKYFTKDISIDEFPEILQLRFKQFLQDKEHYPSKLITIMKKGIEKYLKTITQ